jgi:hypothetical protein
MFDFDEDGERYYEKALYGQFSTSAIINPQTVL